MQLKNSYWWFQEVIDPETCQKIIDLGEQKFSETTNGGIAKTAGNMQKSANPGAAPAGELPLFERDNNTYVRDSYVSWLNDDWLGDLIIPHIHRANKLAGWNWDLSGAEMFQFTKYHPGGFYGWHEDGGSDWHSVYKKYIYGVTPEPLQEDGDPPHGYTLDDNMVGKVRKISMTLNLNPPGEYDGGDLKFDFGVHAEKESRFHLCEEIRPQGSMIVFPSFVKHCVTPVTRGTRYSLVLWSIGEPWK